jgi:hypothetical protein
LSPQGGERGALSEGFSELTHREIEDVLLLADRSCRGQALAQLDEDATHVVHAARVDPEVVILGEHDRRLRRREQELEFISHWPGIVLESASGLGGQPCALLPRRDHFLGEVAVAPCHQIDELLHHRLRVLQPGGPLQIKVLAALPEVLEIGSQLRQEVASRL